MKLLDIEVSKPLFGGTSHKVSNNQMLFNNKFSFYNEKRTVFTIIV